MKINQLIYINLIFFSFFLLKVYLINLPILKFKNAEQEQQNKSRIFSSATPSRVYYHFVK